MSASADAAPPGSEWERLERAAEAAAAAVARWRGRALAAEGEVERLRATLERSLAGAASGGMDDSTRVQAENVLLRSRMEEADRRVTGLLGHLRMLEEEG